MSGAAFSTQDAGRMRRNRFWLGLASIPLLGAFAAALTAAVTGQLAPLAVIPHFTILGTVLLGLVYKLNKNPVVEEGAVTAGDEGVRFKGVLVAPRDTIRQGFVTPVQGRSVVKLTRRARFPLELAVKDQDDGRAMLRALGLDASQSVGRFRSLSRVLEWSGAWQLLFFLSPVILVLLAALLLGPVFPPGAVAIAAVLGVPLIALTMVPTRVSVGVDGVLTRWVGKERFIPFSKVRLVTTRQRRTLNKVYVGVDIVLHDGASIFLPMGQARWGGEGDADLACERIQQAFETYKRGGGHDDAAVLARKGRPDGEWLASLRALGAGANADMRTAPLPRDRLWRIVEDPGAQPVARASAAVALAARVGPEERQRIRIAANTVAEPALRVALDRVADDAAEDESITDALAELEAAEADREAVA